MEYTKPFTVINLFGGPGSGKSTTAAGLFYRMKMNHMSVELVTEYAKDLVYDNRLDHMQDQQEYIFAKQNQRLHRLRDKVRYVITDSPILLSNVYVDDTWACVSEFNAMVLASFNTYDNLNILLRRPEEFQTYGRNHDLEQSKEIDRLILTEMTSCIKEFSTHDVDEDIVTNLANEYFGIAHS